MKQVNSTYLKEIPAWVKECEALRRAPQGSIDITLSELLESKGDGTLTMDKLYEDLGINPNVDTIQNLVNMPDSNYRWIIPEIFRDALRLGLRKAPIYRDLIAGEQSVPQTTVTMPAINMSDAAPRKVGIAETIVTGSVSFDQKTVKINKFGRGIKIPYEVIQYVSLNLVSIFLQDFGVKLGMGIDTMAIDTLLNGDQADGSDSVAVIGVATANSLAYRDTLRPYVRLARLGKNPTKIIAGEDMALDLLDLFTSTRVLGTPRTNVNLKTPLPSTNDVYIHGKIPTNQALMLDSSDALIKLNAQPLLVETEKIVSNQTEATYVSLTTGFATIFRDSRLVMDKSLAFSGNGFPTWMDPSSVETVTFD